MIMRLGSRQVWVHWPEELVVGRRNREGQVGDMGNTKIWEPWNLTQIEREQDGGGTG